MIPVEKILKVVDVSALADTTVDWVYLDHLGLEKSHQRVISEKGKDIGISLNPGTKLCCGAVLFETKADKVIVDLIEEDIIKVFPKNNLEWAKVAFNIGNMHQKAYLYSAYIAVPYDPVLKALLDKLEVVYTRGLGKLDGEKAAISLGNQGHSHHHTNE